MANNSPNKIFWNLSLVFVGFLFLSSFVLAEEINQTDEEKSISCISNSLALMDILSSANFSVIRINDTIVEAKSILEVQQALAVKGRQADYSRLTDLCEEVSDLKILAFEMRDQIGVLEEFYNTSSVGIDTSGIDELFFQIYKEIDNERYELVPELIEKTYSEIIIAQSRLATLNVFYDATTRGLRRFVSERWKEIIVSIIILTMLFFFFKKPVEKRILKARLTGVVIRKKSLKDMISKNQDVYFNKGKMSEEAFTVKNKKLAELVRDVDRQISLYNEQIAALEVGNKKKINKNLIIKKPSNKKKINKK